MKLPEPHTVQNILIVQMSNHIGDTICSLPMYAALKENYPNAEITLVAAVKPYPIPLRELNPFVDHVFYYDKHSAGTLLKFYALLRKRKYQIGIVPPSILLSRTAHIINLLSGARVRVGANSLDGVRNKMRGLLNRRGDFNWVKEETAQPERHLDIIRLLGTVISPNAYGAGRHSPTTNEREEARRFMTAAFHTKPERLIVIHPGAGSTPRIWSTEKFIRLIQKIHEEFHAHIMISAGPDDEKIIAQIRLECAGLELPLLTAPFKLIAGVLSLAELFITNDTGPMHIGGSVGIKMITIHGPSKAFEWAPRGPHIRSIQSRGNDINDITLDEVFEACKELLSIP